jgi:methylated-DNA-[protein]-cysteine S-methyltransferase
MGFGTRRFEMSRYEVATFDTPLGAATVVARGGAVVAFGFDPPDAVLARAGCRERDGDESIADPDPGGAVRALTRYFAGDVHAVDELEVAGRGTEFQRRVWRALRTVPAGSTASYADIAREIGAPRAVRAVGRANGANPIGVIVPCHRVVRSDGSIGGYAGGVERKRWLLDHEHRSGEMRQ